MNAVSGQSQIDPLTSAEETAFKHSDTYIALYGTATYTDSFNIPHWTKFCSWLYGTQGAAYSAAECAKYNNTDSN